MKKTGALFAMLALGALAVCGIVPDAALAAKVQIRVNASSNPKASPDTGQTHWYLKFAEEMKQRAPETAEVKIYWDAQLAKTYADAVNATQNQTIHIMNIPAASLAEYSKAMIPFNALFIVPYPHKGIVREAFKGELGNKIREKVLADTGLRVIAFWDFGFRHILTKDKVINSVEDLKGLKIRCQPNPVQLAAFKAYGTNPTPITWAELFTSLQQGVVAGTENPLANIYQARLYEVTKYCALTGHLLEYNTLLINDKWYAALPEDVKKAFDESVAIANETYTKQFDISEEKFMDMVKSKMTVNTISEAELKKFSDIGRAASNSEVIKQVGQEYYDYFMGELAKSEKAYFEQLKKN